MILDKAKLSLCYGVAKKSFSTSFRVLSQEKVFRPLCSFQKRAYISDFKIYSEQHELSLNDPYAFWSAFAKEFHWKKPPTRENFLQYNFDIGKGPIYIKWMEGAEMNVCYNLVDRHVRNGLGDRVAYYW